MLQYSSLFAGIKYSSSSATRQRFFFTVYSDKGAPRYGFLSFPQSADAADETVGFLLLEQSRAVRWTERNTVSRDTRAVAGDMIIM